MKIKYLIAIASYCAASVAYCDEAGKTAKVEEFMRLAKMDDTMRQVLTMATDQSKAAFLQEMMGLKVSPEQKKEVDVLAGKVSQLLLDVLAWDKLKPAYLKIFTEAYTESELDDIVAFYKSPTGQAMVAKSPALIMKSTALVQQRMAEAQPELKKLMAEFAARAAQQSKESAGPAAPLN